MAIFSCAVSTVGRSTHGAGTAGAHLRYIGRAAAATAIEAAHMPAQPEAARAWMDRQEADARKNARLCTKIRLALPRELTHEQNAHLTRAFLGQLTGGRVPWLYAIHDQGKDRHNPHAHLVLIDKDIDTGKRVLRLSDSPKDREKAGLPANGVEWIRVTWEQCANLALERAGHDARIDRRTLAAQGIDREPTIHIGPRAQTIDTTASRPQSKVVPSPSPHQPERVIDYPMIDAGRTRRERNAEIIDLNLQKATRSPDFETRLWALLEREQRAIDRPLEAQRITAARRRTIEERRLRSRFKAQLREIRNKRHAEAAFVRAWTTQRLAADIAALRARHDAERATLRRQQSTLSAIFMAAVDFTGHTKRRHAAAWPALRARQARERAALAERIRQTRAIQKQAVWLRYEPEIDAIKRDRRLQVSALQERHRDDMLQEDAALQHREAGREQAREALKQQLDAWKKAQRTTSATHQGPT